MIIMYSFVRRMNSRVSLRQNSQVSLGEGRSRQGVTEESE